MHAVDGRKLLGIENENVSLVRHVRERFEHCQNDEIRLTGTFVTRLMKRLGTQTTIC